jgi:3'-phosphoadenosine 5'-phosphosulfate sulfotransferase (PAPS reductase)/FAD synthetase
MNAPEQKAAVGRIDETKVRQLNHALRAATPVAVIESALETVGRDALALVSSFGTESAALHSVAARIDPAIPVIFLDTEWLFEETLAYRDALVSNWVYATFVRSNRLKRHYRAKIPIVNCGFLIRTGVVVSARLSL